MSMQQVEPVDQLAQPREPDRPHYEIGTLLGPEDFYLEQTYHRGRLARVLAALSGAGTLAGLKVTIEPAVAGRGDEVSVSPGLALDRLGRLIEVPRRACVAIERWFQKQREDNPGALAAAFEPDSNSVLADAFIRFVPCERGRTPVFATHTFDGLSAVAASRIRDGYEIKLFPRPFSADLPRPRQRLWAQGFASGAMSARRKALQDAILDAGREFASDFDEKRQQPTRLPEHLDKQDTTFEFLARVRLPAINGTPPGRDMGRPVPNPDNSLRRFVVPLSAVAAWVGIPPPAAPGPDD